MKKKKEIKNLKRENESLTNTLLETILENIRLRNILEEKNKPHIKYEFVEKGK
jgi:hypothetical protein